jgi:tRNA-binding EMAP/Myf-like protein
MGTNMTVENCKKCEHHKKLENGAIHCGHDRNIVCYASVFNPKNKEYVILNCPKERK